MAGKNLGAALIVGGTSGLGFELAIVLAQHYNVTVTGRRNPENEDDKRARAVCADIEFVGLSIDEKTADLGKKIDSVLGHIPQVDLFVYAAGFYQDGLIDKLSEDDIIKMNNVGFLAPAMLLQRILRKQESLPGYIAITSTSQWTPRPREPVYTGVKAGLGHFSHSVSLDPRVKKTLVAGPAGMATRFWDADKRDMNKMLEPKWAAEQIVRLYEDQFTYRFARILRDPPRVDIAETRE